MTRPGNALTLLAEAGISLPAAPPPVGHYARAHRVGDLLWVAGHTARAADRPPVCGVVGEDVDVETAVADARRAAVNLLAAAHQTVGLERLSGVVHLRGYVRTASDFTAHPAVIDGASTLLSSVFPDAPAHSRAAIGVASLPGGACVELEAVFAL
ncbi:RidA family protein [Nocardioides sp. AE5]|uniref:RidA family protein n=1 Tax=Nocardioides sp. AE5 TaxID=2962573 RepID=UPI0028829F55|nr:RidA family protein [Nocardioides sp. AE5]MDT0202488.1 RidA family protein [Nocardioides sp. AE5]